MKVHKVQACLKNKEETIVTNQKWDGIEYSIKKVIMELEIAFPDLNLSWMKINGKKVRLPGGKRK